MSSEQKQMFSLAIPEEEPKRYDSVEYLPVEDNTNGTYVAGSTLFEYDTRPYANKHVVYSESAVAVPMKITGTAAFDATDYLAFKQSALDMINSITVSAPNGSIISKPASEIPWLVNNLRLLADSTVEQQIALRDLLAFDKDRSVGPSVPYTAGAIGTGEFVSEVIKDSTNSDCKKASLTSRSATYNAGLITRSSFFDHATEATEFRGVLWLPLRFLSKFFDCQGMDKPRLGFPLRIQFGLNSATKTFVHGSKTSTITIGSFAGNTMTRCRLYLKCVKLPLDVAKLDEQALRQGKQEMFKFTDYVLTTPQMNKTADPSHELHNSITNPKRMFVVGHPQGKTLGAGDSTAPVQYTLKFSSINYLINGTPLFYNALDTQYAQYEEFLRACGHTDQPDAPQAKKALITFADWKNNYCINAYDLSGVKNQLSSATQPVRIDIRGTRADATAIDYYAIIEVEKVCRVNQNGQTMTVLVSDV